MSRCLTLGVLVSLAAPGVIPDSRAQLTFTWTGFGSSDNALDSGNWSGGVAPVGTAGNETLVFGNVSQTVVDYTSLAALQIQIVGNTRPYHFDGSWDTLTVFSGGIVYSPASPVRSTIDDLVQLGTSQTWNIGSGSLKILGPVSDTGSSFTLTKTGAGSLIFGYTSSTNWTGGLTVTNGKVITRPVVATSGSSVPTAAFGTGPLAFDSSSGGTPTLVTYGGYDDDDELIIPNALNLNGTFRTENDNTIVFTGAVTLQSNVTLNSTGEPLLFNGTISGAGRSLTIDSFGAVVLNPNETSSAPNSYSGGTHVSRGILIFADGSAVPSVGQLSAFNIGYIGYGSDDNVQNDFLNRFDRPNTHGTIGFDTDPDEEVATNITNALDLTGFSASARLGSATEAILGPSAVITPQSGTGYRFGGGGGKLEVQSVLANGAGPVVRGVVLESSNEVPLTVRFTANNTFTGGVSAASSAAIFTPNALPATGTLTLHQAGYIGIESDANPQTFINRFAGGTSTGMIGFDDPSEHATIAGNISLAGFASASPGIYLGTATRAVFSSSAVITPQGTTYRFGAYKGGHLEVASTLSNESSSVLRSVHIGDPNSLGTFGDPREEEYSTVVLSGNNTHGGTTTLYTGELRVGQSNGTIGTDPTTALGTGALIVQPHNITFPGVETSDIIPLLSSNNGGLIISNAVQLNSGLALGGSNNFTLAGAISGAGRLVVGEDDASGSVDIRLASANTFAGGVYVTGNTTLRAATDTSLGTGSLSFGFASGPRVYFESSAPVVNGLSSGDDDHPTIYFDHIAPIFTINQTNDSVFSGEFRSNSSSDALRIVKSGPGTLRFNDGGMFFHSGVSNADLGGTLISLQVNAGTVIFDNDFHIEDSGPTFWVNGGTLATDENAHISNPIVVSSGRLAGHGSFSTVSVSAGATIAPGFSNTSDIGNLRFDHLTLNGGGTYEWQIQGNGSGLFLHDSIDVVTPTTLELSSTSSDRFTLKIISLDITGAQGALSGLSQTHGTYSWLLFSADSIDFNGELSGSGTVADFNPNIFNIDTTSFTHGLALGGTFGLSATSSEIFLTFTPVPEPSTCALMALGIGLLWLASRRRRASL